MTPQVASPQCTARNWAGSQVSTVEPAGTWMADTNAVFLVNGNRLASSDPGGADAADAALSAINNLINAPGITHGVVVDVSDIYGVDDSLRHLGRATPVMSMPRTPSSTRSLRI